MLSFVHSLVYLLEFVISLAIATLEAIRIGFLIIIVGIVILLISSRLGEDIIESGRSIIVGGITGSVCNVFVQEIFANFPSLPSSFKGILFLVPLVPLISSIVALVYKG